MLLLIKLLAKVVAVLNGEVSPRQIASGFALGAWIGLFPFGLIPTVLTFLSFVINVNLAILAVGTAVFAIISYALDPALNHIGLALLKAAPLQAFWTKLYNMPLVPYTRFNNTVVMGALALGFVLLIPLYLIASVGVVAYRGSLRQKVLNSGVMKAVTASTFYKYYVSFRDLKGE